MPFTVKIEWSLLVVLSNFYQQFPFLIPILSNARWIQTIAKWLSVRSKHYYNLKPRWQYSSFCVYRSLNKVSRRELCTSIINPFLFLRRKWFLAFGRTHYACRGSSLSRRRRLYALGWWFDVTYLGWRGLRLWGDRCWWGRGGFLRLFFIVIIVIFITTTVRRRIRFFCANTL